MDYQSLLEEIVESLGPQLGQGEVASYIPPLARISAQKLGMALISVDGTIYQAGDAIERFSIQSMSKVWTLAVAMQHFDDRLWQRVGKEPSGSKFNSLVQLENERGIPRNPFINAGALVVTDVILDHLPDAKQSVIGAIRKLAQSPTIDFDYEVAAGEQATGFRNTAMAWFIKSFGNLKHDPAVVLDAYFHHCSIAMNCVEVAKAGYCLANGGIELNGNRALSLQQSKHINALMLTCGTYDAAGEFAYRIGLAAKSGVGGGILAVLPGKFAVCVWSPALGPSGNSLVGMKALAMLTQRTGFSIF